MRTIVKLSGIVLCVWAATDSLAQPPEAPALVPELSDLDSEADKGGLTNSMRKFESVIEQARTSESYAIGENMKYNEQRRKTLTEELKNRRRAIDRLDAVVSIKYDEIRDRFGGEIPEAYGPSVNQLRRQHEVIQSRLLREMETYTADLSEIDARLSRGAVEYEIAKVRETLMEPAETFDPAALGKQKTSKQPDRDTLSYLEQLSYHRIVGRSMRIASIGPRPMSGEIINHLIAAGS